jgi:hypothetical protein
VIYEWVKIGELLRGQAAWLPLTEVQMQQLMVTRGDRTGLTCTQNINTTANIRFTKPEFFPRQGEVYLEWHEG